jgi:hypothetical protein
LLVGTGSFKPCIIIGVCLLLATHWREHR